MKRSELEHIIRAAGSIANAQELVVIGSQAILGTIPEPPDEFTASVEADVYPTNDPGKADLIDGSIGEKSPFHDTFGYYAHGVRPETATLPANWKSRLVRIRNQNTNQVTGLCLSVADLVISKLAAGREKDLDFVRVVFHRGLLKPAEAEAVLAELPLSVEQVIRPRLARCAGII